MTTKEKIFKLQNTMQVRKRLDSTEFTCFSDTAPEELKDLFLEHYEVRDLDYIIFSKAIDVIVETAEEGEDDLQNIIEQVQNTNDFASPYNTDRLAYLNIFNDDEITGVFKEYECMSVSQACAIWYDDQVHAAVEIIINEYILK